MIGVEEAIPPIDETIFAPGPREPHPDDSALALQRWTRRSDA